MPTIRAAGALCRPALVLLGVFTLLTGVLYPLAVTALARLLFPAAADGSLILRDGAAVGSRLIGQSFADPGHFWGRPSATTPQPYNATASTGSNVGPTNPALVEAVPIDLVTASASGLDPEISIAAAEYQAARVARARGLDPARVRALLAAHSKGRLLAILGEPRVNVLELNLALDALK
jgi:K+-transporting ATPase ATPase C chain